MVQSVLEILSRRCAVIVQRGVPDSAAVRGVRLVDKSGNGETELAEGEALGDADEESRETTGRTCNNSISAESGKAGVGCGVMRRR